MVNRKSQFIERFGDPITNPKGWPVMQLQDIVCDDCSISYGIVKPGDDVPDGVPVFRPVDIVGKKPEITELKRTSKAISDQYKRTLLTGRELLLTVRANIGDTCIIGDEFKGCNVGRGIVPIRVKEDLMSLEFLKCQMDFDTMHDYIQSLSKGITLIQLNMEDLRKIAFIVPPVDLQKEYLSIVCQSDKSKFTVGRRFKSQFIEMFGTVKNNEKGWPMMPMNEAATRLSDGPFGSNLKSEHYRPEGVRVIRLQNICDGYFLDDDKAYVGWDHYEKLKKYTCHAGDIVIGTLGEPNLRACLIPDNIETAINKADCVQYIPRPELLDKRFVCAFINSPATLEMAIGDVHGNTRQRISSGQLAKLPIMIPPMELQEEYAAFIEQSDKSKLSVQNKLSAFRRLTYRILKFEGGLRNVQ